MSKLGFTALIAGLGYLMFKVLVGAAMLLYYLCKIAVLLPFAIYALIAGNVQISRSDDGATTARVGKPSPPHPAPAPDLGPASVDTTGDWHKDRETLIRLLNEGKIK